MWRGGPVSSRHHDRWREDQLIVDTISDGEGHQLVADTITGGERTQVGRLEPVTVVVETI